MNLPKISVITVTYNCAEVLEKTLQSVDEQKYPSIEHIVIDGKSTDATNEIISRNKEKLSYYISEPDSGLYDAMNKGISVAKGEFIFFLNSGDVFHQDDVLLKIFSGMKERDVVVFGYVRILTKLGKWYSPYEGQKFGGGDLFIPHHQSIFYPSTYYRSNRFDRRFPTHADIVFSALACRSCRKIFRPVHTVDSTMGGFATNLFRSRKRVRLLITELSQIDDFVSGSVTNLRHFQIWINSYIKFITCAVFGDVALYQLYRLNSFVGALRRRAT
jgi:glycosyltransferase involved in cell wall biosynthesis